MSDDDVKISSLAAAIRSVRTLLGDEAADEMSRAAMAAMRAKNLPSSLFEHFDEDLDGV